MYNESEHIIFIRHERINSQLTTTPLSATLRNKRTKRCTFCRRGSIKGLNGFDVNRCMRVDELLEEKVVISMTVTQSKQLVETEQGVTVEIRNSEGKKKTIFR